MVALSYLVSYAAAQGQCAVADKPAPQQRVYRVGVMAIRGIETALAEFDRTFGDYLSYAAGRQFDPPIAFETVPVNFGDIVDELSRMDFVFANPSVFSCIESEVGANSLVSQISQKNVNGNEFNLIQFGGVIFTKAENNGINSIEDIKGKRVVTAGITGLGSGQMQFRELQRAGVHHLQDPEQLLFTGNQGKVVRAVMDGLADVGYVRTDQLERSVDPNTGSLLDLSLIKIIGARDGLASDGEPFPFQSSTSLYPEWNVASLPTVSAEVARKVQSVLLALDEHAAIAPLLLACYESRNCTATECFDECFVDLDPMSFKHCDTTAELALLANDAMTNGKYSGWRPTMSYMELRNMQEEIRFINRDEDIDGVRCVRAVKIADAVVCPPEHFKKSEEDINSGCEDAGLDCFGYQCLCSPCVRAFDVDFSPVSDVKPLNQILRGCSKFQVCGIVEQASAITFRAVDNKARQDSTFWVNVIVGDESESFNMTRSSDSKVVAHDFTFNATSRRTGVVIIEVYADESQISESPFRLQVTERDCESDTGDTFRVADRFGECICGDNTIEIGDTCVPRYVLLPSIFVPVAAILAIALYLYVERKRKEADSVWQVKPEELVFQEPPKIIGRGTFGLVLLAEYRGTQVAVKRVLPPREKPSSKGSKIPTHGSADSQFDLEDLEGGTSAPDCDASAAPEIRERLQKYLGKSGHAAKQGSTRSGNLATRTTTMGKNFSSNLFDFGARPVALSRKATTSSIPSSDGDNLPDDFGMKTGHFHGKKFSLATGVQSVSIDGKRSSSRLKSNVYVQMQSEFIEEMRYLSKLRHPCITTVMGAIIAKNSEPMLVMEFMQLGSLYDLLHNDSMVLEGDLVLHVLQDIASGLRFLHSAAPKVIHGDLKSQNILVDSKFHAKVADFGLTQKNQSNRTGTPLWMAPELLRAETSNTAATDIYSFGIILYEVFSRKDPYEGENHMETLRNIADKNVNKRPPVPRNCPSASAKLMQKCWQGEVADRPNADEIDVALKSMDMGNVDPLALNLRHMRNSARTERTEDLLFQLFPRHIAEALRDGCKIEPESFDCVTVYFSDIVGYTNISSTLSPQKVSDLLDRLYTKFDNLCGIHNVFKVETVGRCLSFNSRMKRSSLGVFTHPLSSSPTLFLLQVMPT